MWPGCQIKSATAKSAGVRGVAAEICSVETRGIFTPARDQEYDVSPEQSKPPGWFPV